jgi:hypothetical protein
MGTFRGAVAFNQPIGDWNTSLVAGEDDTFPISRASGQQGDSALQEKTQS